VPGRRSASELLEEAVAIIGEEIGTIGDLSKDEPLGGTEARNLCEYAKVLLAVSKATAGDTPEDLAELSDAQLSELEAAFRRERERRASK
jgi:hypothetical protein